MRKISAVLAAAMFFSTALTLTGCSEKYEFSYDEGSYKGDTSDIFSMDWDTMSLFSEVDEKMESELPDKIVTVKGNKLKGLFANDIELIEEDNESYFDISSEYSDSSDVKKLAEEYGDTYDLDHGVAYIIPIHIECEISDGELWVEAKACTEDGKDTYDISFGFNIDKNN